ncbi:hypothetical protein MCHI_002437 [Candidatus Magnetoovum chiemensis]|nr:hypothetical protein MCHI_002437 [Candidatus Magnetoovum chiemensis]
MLKHKHLITETRMKKLIYFLLLFTTMIFLTPASSNAEEEKNFSGSAALGVYSNYVWRGLKLSKGVVIQPSVTATYYGVSANLWANYDTDLEEANETDYTLSYSHSFGKISLTPGYIYYSLDGIPDTQELYLSISADVILKPTFTWYYDFDAGNGSFLVLSIGHSFALPKNIALNLVGSLSYTAGNELMGTDESGGDLNDFYNGEIYVSASIPVWKAISIEPKLAYSFALSDASETIITNIIDANDYDGDSNIVYGGVNFLVSF